MQLAAAYIYCFVDFLCFCDLQKVCKKSKTVLIFHVKLGISEKEIYFCNLYRALLFKNEIQNFFEKSLYFSQLFFTVIHTSVTSRFSTNKF